MNYTKLYVIVPDIVQATFISNVTYQALIFIDKRLPQEERSHIGYKIHVKLKHAASKTEYDEYDIYFNTGVSTLHFDVALNCLYDVRFQALSHRGYGKKQRYQFLSQGTGKVDYMRLLFFSFFFLCVFARPAKIGHTSVVQLNAVVLN